ncbi:retinol dehydrogenase 12-like [Adelges cooleyi]|uniref:retinol dehydrogenase 12-like n=1 Tax=Adelges cooleyi TaxID=133065 RepID=UPI00217FAAAE|nr:retinol dehydrogenase 12-like [Adelges cooleyi]
MIHFFIDFFKQIKYQIIYYFLGAFAIIDDIQNRDKNQFDISQHNKVAVVTGGARGIGLEVVKKLLQCNLHVIVGCRDVSLGFNAIKQIAPMNGSFVVYKLDLKSFASVKNFAQQVLSKYDQIHLLVNNAGVMFVPYEKCENGHEAHWTTNYLSHFLLTELLLPVLKSTGVQGDNARIVNVTSCAHEASPPIDFDTINNEEGYITNAAYAKSKLAQLIFTKYLNKILADFPVKAFAVHPGVVDTELFNGTFLKIAFPWILKYICKTPEEGSRSIVYVCLSDAVDGRGYYYANCQPAKYLPYADDAKIQEILYTISKNTVEKYLNP